MDIINNSVTRPTIIYFPIRGRAELLRYFLEDQNTDYDDIKIPLQDWPAMKPLTPFGKLPIYKEPNLMMTQTNAIMRHLARTHALYGTSVQEETQCDILQEAFNDAFTEIVQLFWHPKFAEKKDSFIQKALPTTLFFLEKTLKSNQDGQGFWVGDNITFVDYYAAYYLDWIRPLSIATLEQFPTLHAFKKRMEERPNLKAYLNSDRRPKCFTVSLAQFGHTPETS